MKTEDYVRYLEELAPLTLSEAFVEAGAYDNSGLIVKTHVDTKKVLFSLDLTQAAIAAAKREGADTVVTHHPAIYRGAERLITGGENGAVLRAAEEGLNVLSFHLNLDIARGGVDDTLAKTIGIQSPRVIKRIAGDLGYGREGAIEETTFSQFVRRAKTALSAVNACVYGSPNATLKKAASFCGAGGSDAEEYVLSGGDADVIVTSDAPHHVIKTLLDANRCVFMPTHYAAELPGLKTLCDFSAKKVPSVFFTEERFL